MTLQSKCAAKKSCLYFYSRGRNLGLISGDCRLHNSANVPKIGTAISGRKCINQVATKFKHLCIQQMHESVFPHSSSLA